MASSEQTQLKVPSFLCRRDDRHVDYPIRNSPLCSWRWLVTSAWNAGHWETNKRAHSGWSRFQVLARCSQANMPSEAPMSINASQSSMRTDSQQLRCFMELRCDTLYLDYCKVPSTPFLFKLKTSSLQASFKLAQMHIFKVSWDFSLTLSQFGSTWPGRIGAGE